MENRIKIHSALSFIDEHIPAAQAAGESAVKFRSFGIIQCPECASVESDHNEICSKCSEPLPHHGSDEGARSAAIDLSLTKAKIKRLRAKRSQTKKQHSEAA